MRILKQPFRAFGVMRRSFPIRHGLEPPQSICMLRTDVSAPHIFVQTPGAVGVRKLGEEQQSEEDGRQSQFGKQAGPFLHRLGFFPPIHFL